MRRNEPPAVWLVRNALGQLDRVVMATLESYSDPVDRAWFLGKLKRLRDQLKDAVALVEAKVASDDWGTGPRGGPKKNLESEDLTATKSTSMTYTWEERALLFKVCEQRLTNLETGERPSDEIIWDLVTQILKYGKYEPRVTELYADRLYDRDSIRDIRKTTEGRTSVAVKLAEEEVEGDADTEAEPSGEASEA